MNEKTALRRALLDRRRGITPERSRAAGIALLARARDAGLLDAVSPGTGLADKGLLDAGSPDAGLADRGWADAGSPDADLVDRGLTDAGSIDAGASGAAPQEAAGRGASGRRAPTVAAFEPIRGEIDTTPLIDAWLAAGVRVIVPASMTHVAWRRLRPTRRCAPDAAGDARGAADDGTTADGRHENDDRAGADATELGPDALAEADLVLVPALAVDAAGTRLGRGGGWYDRALAHRAPHARVVAVCWPWECVDRLPREPHDAPVDAALTPARVMPTGTWRPRCHGAD